MAAQRSSSSSGSSGSSVRRAGAVRTLVLGVATALLAACTGQGGPSETSDPVASPASGGGAGRLVFRQVFAAESVDLPTSVPSAKANPRPLPDLPQPPASPRPTVAATPAPGLDSLLAWQPSERDYTEFAAYTCVDPSPTPDVVDQPLITCARDEPVKFLLGPVLLSGRDVADARASVSSNAEVWLVTVRFSDAGAANLAAVTGALASQAPPRNELAIVLDSRVLSSPGVQQAIAGGTIEINGNFSQEAAEGLESALRG